MPSHPYDGEVDPEERGQDHGSVWRERGARVHAGAQERPDGTIPAGAPWIAPDTPLAQTYEPREALDGPPPRRQPGLIYPEKINPSLSEGPVEGTCLLLLGVGWGVYSTLPYSSSDMLFLLLQSIPTCRGDRATREWEPGHQGQGQGDR